IRFGNDLSFDKRLFHSVQLSRIREFCWVGYDHSFIRSFFHVSIVAYVGNGSNYGHVKLSLQALLDNLHVEHSQKSASETETKSGRRFRFKSKGSIIQLEFFQRSTKLFKLLG